MAPLGLNVELKGLNIGPVRCQKHALLFSSLFSQNSIRCQWGCSSENTSIIIECLNFKSSQLIALPWKMLLISWMVFQWGVRAIKLQLLANPSQKCCSDTLKVMAKLFFQLQSKFLNHRCTGKHTEPVYWPTSKNILSKTITSTITASMSHSNKKRWF